MSRTAHPILSPSLETCEPPVLVVHQHRGLSSEVGPFLHLALRGACGCRNDSKDRYLGSGQAGGESSGVNVRMYLNCHVRATPSW